MQISKNGKEMLYRYAVKATLNKIKKYNWESLLRSLYFSDLHWFSFILITYWKAIDKGLEKGVGEYLFLEAA